MFIAPLDAIKWSCFCLFARKEMPAPAQQKNMCQDNKVSLLTTVKMFFFQLQLSFFGSFCRYSCAHLNVLEQGQRSNKWKSNQSEERKVSWNILVNNGSSDTLGFVSVSYRCFTPFICQKSGGVFMPAKLSPLLLLLFFPLVYPILPDAKPALVGR